MYKYGLWEKNRKWWSKNKSYRATTLKPTPLCQIFPTDLSELSVSFSHCPLQLEQKILLNYCLDIKEICFFFYKKGENKINKVKAKPEYDLGQVIFGYIWELCGDIWGQHARFQALPPS